MTEPEVRNALYKTVESALELYRLRDRQARYFLRKLIEARKRLDVATQIVSDSVRGHYYCDDSWYSCPKAEDGCADESQGDGCNCSAEEWNARMDRFLNGEDT